MNPKLETIRQFFWRGKRRYIPVAVLILLVGGIWRARSGNDDAAQAGIFKVEKVDVIQEVTVTGNVKPAQNVELSFDTSGRVAGVYVSVGSRVGPGTLIASLANGNLRADVEKAEATLAELKKGARPEDIAVTEADLAKAKQDLENYYDSTRDTLEEALLGAGDALTSNTDALFSNANTNNPLLNFSVSNYQNKVDTEESRISANQAIGQLTTLTNTLSGDFTTQKEALGTARELLEKINTYLGVVYNAVNNATGLSATTQATYKTDITTARTSVTSGISAINTLLQSIASQEATVVKNENALALKKAGPTAEALSRAQADVTSARAILAKTLITSPITGIVSKAKPKQGETVTAGAALFEVISAGKFEIEVNVPEVDVAKVAIGNAARVTLDAYGDDVVFLTHVSKIDPAENVIEGVPTYTTTLLFDMPDTRVRSGMTANITIETGKKENVLAIPGRAVITQDGKKIVRVQNEDGTVREVPVTIGLRGSAGLVEVISGLNENDRVLTQASGT